MEKEPSMEYTFEVPSYLRNEILDETKRLAAEMISEDIQGYIKTKVMESVKEKLDSIVMEAANEILDKEVQRTNSWGEAEGNPTPLATVVRDMAIKYFGTPVSRSSGAPTHTTGRGTCTRAEFMIQTYATAGIDKVAKDELRKLNQDAKDRIAAVISTRVLSELEAKAAWIKKGGT